MYQYSTRYCHYSWISRIRYNLRRLISRGRVPTRGYCIRGRQLSSPVAITSELAHPSLTWRSIVHARVRLLHTAIIGSRFGRCDRGVLRFSFVTAASPFAGKEEEYCSNDGKACCGADHDACDSTA